MTRQTPRTMTPLGAVARLFGGAAALAIGTWYVVGLIAGAYPPLSGAVLGAALVIPGGWAIADLAAAAQEADGSRGVIADRPARRRDGGAR